MTAHIPATMFDDHHTTTTATGTKAAILPFHVGTDLETEQPDPPELALGRLKAFLYEEAPGLARIISLLALSGAQVDLEALGKVQSEPADPKQALADAERLLNRLVEDLAEVPSRTEIQRPIQVVKAAIVRDLEAWVR